MYVSFRVSQIFILNSPGQLSWMVAMVTARVIGATFIESCEIAISSSTDYSSACTMTCTPCCSLLNNQFHCLEHVCWMFRLKMETLKLAKYTGNDCLHILMLWGFFFFQLLNSAVSVFRTQTPTGILSFFLDSCYGCYYLWMCQAMSAVAQWPALYTDILPIRSI